MLADLLVVLAYSAVGLAVAWRRRANSRIDQMNQYSPQAPSSVRCPLLKSSTTASSGNPTASW